MKLNKWTFYKALDWLGTPLRKWFVYNHGEGEPGQPDFYRCMSCSKVVTWKRIREGGCACYSNRIVPTKTTLLESLRIMVLPWTV